MGAQLDLTERGRGPDGQTVSLDRRLYMELLAFGGSTDVRSLAAALDASGLEGVLYEDVHDPRGVGLLLFAEDPDALVSARGFLNRPPFGDLELKPELAMLGRTYAVGYERDLENVLLRRPRQRACSLPWAVWYPLRRSGSFEQLSDEERHSVLMEHGETGRMFGEADRAHDIRLACHGLDRNDNDFVIGLVGRELHPLSMVVQRMRSTRQTSSYLARLGPFFVGRNVWSRMEQPMEQPK